MNKTLTIVFLLFAFVCNAQEKIIRFQWNLEKERIHNEYRNDSTQWSQKCWEADTTNINCKGEPMIKGVFPVPDYDLVDSTFKGGGYKGSWKGIKLRDKTIVYHSLYLKQCAINREYIPNKPNEVFFTIVALTDTIDTQRFTHTNVSLTSRNLPHYIGQGFIKSKSNKIDFISFLSADRNSYAIVNMRLFDLRIGRIVLIAPQKDGTLRSLQLDSPVMEADEMDHYIKALLKKDSEVIDFFTKPGNI